MNSLRFYLAALCLLVVLAVYATAADEQAVTTPKLVGLDGVTLSLYADGAAQVTTDTGTLYGKSSYFLKMDTDGDGTDEHILVRLQRSSNGIWIDLVADTSVANVDSRVNLMDLSTQTPNHPSPTEDAADSAAITAAGS